MTKTSEAQDPKCYFCQSAATAAKREAEYVETDSEDIIEVKMLPICDTCPEEYYDGTEEFPGLLPLTALAG